jgi:lipoyl(octanoyl) transferase
MTRIKFLSGCTYSDALAAQDSEYKSKGDSVDLIAFEVARPVVTLGRSAKHDLEVFDQSIEVLPVDRGGQATLHSPGQLVLFPIWRLSASELGVRERACGFLEALSQAIEVRYDLKTELLDGSGLFTREAGSDQVRKLAFSGFRVKNKQVHHGFALNISNDLSVFSKIRSCGVNDRVHDRLQNYVDSEIYPKIVMSEISSELLFA